ncbi:CRPV-206 [Crowpox virus]|nr:CRPV-206 [Crowpox virus]
MILYLCILLSYFTYTIECITFSQALLSYLKIDEEDVTGNFRNDIIVQPTGYENKEYLTLYGYFINRKLHFPNHDMYFNNYRYSECSVCIYYKKTDNEKNIIINYYGDTETKLYKTIKPNDNWICILLPSTITEEIEYRDTNIKFTVIPDELVDFTKKPFMELYIVDAHNIDRTVSQTSDLHCSSCRYTLKDMKLKMDETLNLLSRKKRQVVLSDPEFFQPVHKKYKPYDEGLRQQDLDKLEYRDEYGDEVPDFGECLLRHKHMKFKDLGCNWILRPKSFIFTYCKGTCIISSFTRSSIIYGSMFINDIKKNVQICCSPVTRSNITILYMLGKNVKEYEIKDFLPSSCGC